MIFSTLFCEFLEVKCQMKQPYLKSECTKVFIVTSFSLRPLNVWSLQIAFSGIWIFFSNIRNVFFKVQFAINFYT